jgi:hypothetical protein
MDLRQACRDICPVLQSDRTKTFHVKRFCKIGGKNPTWPLITVAPFIRKIGQIACVIAHRGPWQAH